MQPIAAKETSQGANPRPARGFRLIPAVDQSPRAVRFVSTPLGKIVVLCLFGGLLRLREAPAAMELTAFAALASFFPSRRRILAAAGTLWWLFRFTIPNMTWIGLRTILERERLPAAMATPIEYAATVGALVLWAAFTACAFRNPKSGLIRRPIVLMIVTVVTLACLAVELPMPGLARAWMWAATAALAWFLWFAAYSVADRGARDRSPLATQFGTWQPVWYGMVVTPLPIPKGAAYLRRIEAKSAEDLAITQIKGLKLMVWLMLLTAILRVLQSLVHGEMAESHSFGRLLGIGAGLSVPPFAVVFRDSIMGHPAPWLVRTIAYCSDLVETFFATAIGHGVVVVYARMFGFRALRAMWRPLSAGTLAEFWNRYNYYFKELLMDFFFYPCFTRYFKKNPRVRLFAATFGAAGVGNAIYHFVYNIDAVASYGVLKAITGYHVYVFYCLVLGVAIAVSQYLQNSRKGPAPAWRRALAPAGVLAFFAVIHIFDDPGRAYSLADHFRFLAGLFGIGV